MVLKLEIQVTDSAEEDRVVYQENLLGSRNTDRIFKHLKSLNKSACLPKVLMNDTKQSSLRCENVNMLNQFFHSVFSLKTNFSLKDFKVQKPSLTNFDISKNTIRNIMDDIDATKSRGNADYDAINEHLVEKSFQPICYTNIAKMCEEFTGYLDGIFDLYVPKRTRHRKSLPPWIFCGTPNLITKLRTQKRLFEN